MIRPHSEIEYPPSPSQILKARMMIMSSDANHALKLIQTTIKQINIPNTGK